jgi:hypothetical protein
LTLWALKVTEFTEDAILSLQLQIRRCHNQYKGLENDCMEVALYSLVGEIEQSPWLIVALLDVILLLEGTPNYIEVD